MGDSIGNKTADKITSAGKSKSKAKKKVMKEVKYKKFTYLQKNVNKLLMT